jgi:hypothetical protein
VGTFLATRKMDPALVARIERSVGSRPRVARAKPSRARLRTSLLRLTIAVAVTALATTAIVARRRYQQEMASARASLLDTVHAMGATLTPEERTFLSRVEPWITGLAGVYEGDIVADELRLPKGLDVVLARPSVYVRGPVAAFGNSNAIADTASASTRDSLILCMIDPPASRAEKAVLSKVRAAYGGGANVADHVRRLHDAESGLKQILAPWEERIRNASELRDIDHVKFDLGKVPVEEAKRALRADLLIIAMDEPDEAGPADLDGERPHQVRVALIDLPSAKIVLRTRRRVDPNWLAATTRSNFASAVDGCALALDIRSGVR